MIDEWLYLVGKYTIAGARSKFEDICTSLFKKRFPGEMVKSVRIVVGDGGVDIFIGDIGKRPITVVQCKFFINGIDESQKGQIRKSFKTVLGSTDFKVCKWILCVPEKLSIKEHNWWSAWRNGQIKEHKLSQDFIELIDGADLIDDLRTFGIYNEVFDENHKRAIEEIHKQVIGKDKFMLQSELLSASVFMKNLKNYFSKCKDAHIQRKETDAIITWVKGNLPGKDPLEKVLVLKGKKGVGKSTILKDAYCQLIIENEYLALAVKCDQFYDANLEHLAKQLFTNVASFTNLISAVEAQGNRFIVFLDQLDALSQTLSSDRRWLQTYVKLIYELINCQNVRIVISTRNFDLEYDADLRRFNDGQNIKHIEVGNLSTTEVKNILKLLDIEVKSELLIDLLTVPYNLELFTKIPDLAELLKKEARISLSRLYSELWSQVLSKKELKLIACLNAIIKRMNEQHPNLIDQAYLEDFKAEIDYLVSHDILLKNGIKLSFFHQSFYEYYLARWFVVSNKDLVVYILEEGQNLYIRSLIKTVIEYLREADHLKYIDLYRRIIAHDQIRYHIKYLFIVEIGLVEDPSEKEKELISELLPNQFGKLFLDVFISGGWIEFFVSNDLLPESGNETYGILHRNVNHRPKLVLDYLADSKFEQKENFAAGLIPSIQIWDSGLVPFFSRYYPYNEDTELWYFETLKKIAPFDLVFALDKLRPAILAAKTRTERVRFDYRFEKIIDFLYQQNSKALAKFLFLIQLEILEDTKHPYYSEYSGITSELLSSYHYDNGLFYKDSKDEKSIDFYLLKYYRQCDRSELKELVDNYLNTNYVSLLILFTKLLRDRASEFVDEIYQLLVTIESKNGLKEIDDFFQLNIRKLIGKSILYFDNGEYQRVKSILLGVTHPYEIWKDEFKGKRTYKLNLGRKKYLFIKALPIEVLQNDSELKSNIRCWSDVLGRSIITRPSIGTIADLEQ